MNMNKPKSSSLAAKYLAVCFCTAWSTQSTLAQAQPLVAQTAPSLNEGTHEAENGAILEREAFGPILRWDNVKGPGRFRLTLRLRVFDAESSDIVVQTPGPKRLPLEWKNQSGYTFDALGQWKQVTWEFPLEAGQSPLLTLPERYQARVTPYKAGKIQIEKASLQLEKLDAPVFISWARPSRLRYKKGQPAFIETRVTNASGAAQSVEVRPVVLSEADARVPGASQKASVAPQETLVVKVPFALPKAEGSYEGGAELVVNGKVVEARGDVFVVSDSPDMFMIDGGGSQPGFPYFLNGTGNLGLEGYRKQVLNRWPEISSEVELGVEALRRDYITHMEFFGWAREDATMLTENSDEPYLAGQTWYVVSRPQIKLMNRLMHENGIATAAYVNGVPFGWPAIELFRRNPEWFNFDTPTGQPGGLFDTAVLERYLKNDPGGGDHPTLDVNYEGVSGSSGQRYLDYHKQQLAASARMYGWDSVRYDAGPLPTKHFPEVRDYLAKQNPPIGIGNNLGTYVLGRQPSKEWTTYTGGGAVMMEEVTTYPFGDVKSPYRRWAEYIELLRIGTHLTRSNGGYYSYINSHGNWMSNAIGYMTGGHPYDGYGVHRSPFGNYERFMLRYGYHFWDLRTQMLPNPEKVVNVTSARPVWWKRLVSRRKLEGARRQVIVPLLNAPAGEDVTSTTRVAPADGVKVAFKPPANAPVKAWLLAPEPVARRVALATRKTARGVEVDVPRFWGWSNVVFEYSAPAGAKE